LDAPLLLTLSVVLSLQLDVLSCRLGAAATTSLDDDQQYEAYNCDREERCGNNYHGFGRVGSGVRSRHWREWEVLGFGMVYAVVGADADEVLVLYLVSKAEFYRIATAALHMI